METFKYQTYRLLNPQDHHNRISNAVNLCIISLILINVVAASLETVPSLRSLYAPSFFLLEIFSVLIFTLEYVLRLWSVSENKKSPSKVKFFLSFNSVIDLLSIAPFYIGILFNVDLRVLVALRLLRLLKLVRYFEPLAILGTVMKAEFRSFMSALFVLVILIFVAATGIYFFERDVQPDGFGSIPQSMWWAIVTLTTLGYGDVVPATIAGRIFAALITIFSIGAVALPAGMLASRFSEELRKTKSQFSNLIEKLNADGQLSDADNILLEEERLRMCLSEDDVKNLLKVSKDGGNNLCPHCGK